MKKLSVLALLLLALPVQAERRPEDRKEAKLIVTGKVEKIEAKNKNWDFGGVMTTYTVTIAVAKVEKGDGAKVGDTIKATWFHLTKESLIPMPTTTGHKHDIKAKDEATFWLKGDGKKTWEVIYSKDGIEKAKKK